MPYASMERPSVALGTLAAALKQDAIITRTIHANLMFAERIGMAAYEQLNNSDITSQMGEWTFSEAAFGASVRDAREFFAGLYRDGYPEVGLEDWLLKIRAAATAFVDDLAERVVGEHPRIVGCSSVFQQHCASLAFLRRVHEIDPAIVTMLGGANCEASMGVVTHEQYQWVDFVVSGEADKLLPDLCRQVFEYGREVPVRRLPHGVLGPTSRRGRFNGQASKAHDAPRALVNNLDELPIPDFDDYFEQLERSPLRDHILPGLAIETSRGCWWGAKHHCTFCGLNGVGMAFRAKSENRVQNEVLSLCARYGLRKFMTVDNILDHRYFAEVLPSFAEHGNLLFFYETKANLNRSQVELLSRAGVRWIQPGIEALDDDLLKLIRKGCSVSINVQLLKWAHNYGIWVIWNHLYGAPDDKPEWYEKIADWLPMIMHLQPPTTGGMTRIRYDRFSPYFDNAEAFGLKLVPYWAYSHVYPVDQPQLMDQAYFFCHEGPVNPPPARLGSLMFEWAAMFYGERASASALPHRSEEAPVLAMTGDGDRISIRDTRPCAVAPHHKLSVLETQICRACDAARNARGIVSALRTEGSLDTDEAIAAARQRLVDLKIVADFDGKFLCLATDDNPVPYLGFEDFAGGLALLAGRRPATPSTDPWETHVHDLFVRPTVPEEKESYSV